MADVKNAQNQAEKKLTPVAPGTVVAPGSAPTPIVDDVPPVQEAAPAAPTPQPEPQPLEPEPIPAAPVPVPQPDPTPTPQPPAPSKPIKKPKAAEPPKPIYQVHASTSNEPDVVAWTASEFVAHDKSAEWYMLLAAGTAAAAALIYILTKDYISVSVVIVAAVLFGIYGAHKPRQLQYRVDPGGIKAGNKTYGYNEFHSFSIQDEGAFSSIVLMPLKRFAVPISIYFAPQDEDKILELLSQQLPYEQRRRDAVDSLMRKVRF